MDPLGIQHLTPPLAHLGHWYAGLAYFAPVAAFLIWLTVVTRRDRKAAEREAAEDESVEPE